MTAPTPDQLRVLADSRDEVAREWSDYTIMSAKFREDAAALRAAADEVERLRAAVDHMVPEYTLPQFSRVMRERMRYRVVIENAPHSRECNYSGPHWPIRCTCWKADAL